MTRNIWIEPGGFRAGRDATISGITLRSLRDRILFAPEFRGYRCAQPPANGSHPSGMVRVTQTRAMPAIQQRGDPVIQTGGLNAIGRFFRSNATTPPVADAERDRIPEGRQRTAARVDGHLKQMGAVWT